MGARLGKDQAESSSVVIIVYPGGKRETYSRPVSAQEVLLQHPQHVLSHKSHHSRAIVKPKAVLLMPGNEYYIVPRDTVNWVFLNHHYSISTRNESGYGTDPRHMEINVGSSPILNGEGTNMTLQDPIIESPRSSQDGIEEKPNMTLAEARLQRVTWRGAKGARPKSPLGIARNTESSPLSWRSSPKVFPGGEGDLTDGGQVSDIGFVINSPATKNDGKLLPSPIEDEHKHRKASRSLLEASGHAPFTNHLEQLTLPVVRDQTHNGFKKKLSSLVSRSTSTKLALSPKQKASAYDDLSESPASMGANHENKALQRERGSLLHRRSRSLHESREAYKEKTLSELLKYPDRNIISVKDREHLRANVQIYKSSKQNNFDSLGVEPEVHERMGDMLKECGRSASGGVFCPDQDDKRHEWAQSGVIQEPLSHGDPGGTRADNIQDIAKAYDNNKGLECNKLLESTSRTEFKISVATCVDKATKVRQQNNDCCALIESSQPNSACGDLQILTECQLKENRSYVPSENMLDPLIISNVLGDSSYSESIDFGARQKEKNVSSQFSSSLLPTLLSPSALASSPPLPASSMLTSMFVDLPKPEGGDQSWQVGNLAETQSNLAMLGFSSLCSNNLSICEQAKAHIRAHVGDFPKQEEEEQSQPSKQPRAKKEALRPWARLPTSSQRRIFSLTSRRIKVMLERPRILRTLSPILEVSPEVSLASFSSLTECTSSST